jgi:hypothetical protein
MEDIFPNVEHFAYNATLYSNRRKIFQRFETCKYIFTLRKELIKMHARGFGFLPQDLWKIFGILDT